MVRSPLRFHPGKKYAAFLQNRKKFVKLRIHNPAIDAISPGTGKKKLQISRFIALSGEVVSISLVWVLFQHPAEIHHLRFLPKIHGVSGRFLMVYRITAYERDCWMPVISEAGTWKPTQEKVRCEGSGSLKNGIA